MTRFYCRKCGYKFESGKTKGACPYCGKKEIAEEQSAEEILHDVEDLME